MTTLPLAMHMANELLNLPTASVTLVLAAVIVGISTALAARRLDAEKLPLMGVMGAFVFAAQMINFTLPGMPGTSGHLGGGVLLAVLLGPAAGIVVMTAILIVQCLLFQDGGLLALGCNILNMGVIPCLLGWGVYRLCLGRSVSAVRQYVAAWAACVVGVAGGAAMVPVESAVAGMLKIRFVDFLAVMVGVHLVIGFVEGAITFAVLAYIRRVRPATLGLTERDAPAKLSRPAVLATLLATALLLAGVISWFASTHPDGLEWAYTVHRYEGKDAALAEPSPAVRTVDDWQSKWSPMSDYTRRTAPMGQKPESIEENQSEPSPSYANVDGWQSLAGILGTLVVLAVLYAVAAGMRRSSHRRPGTAPARSPHAP
jgi:cobalt/nickel transport system permease protein